MKPTRHSESMFSALVRDHARVTDGSQRSFANRIGMNNTALSSMISGRVTSSRSSQESLSRIAEETGKPVEVLEKLAGITVDEACDLIVALQLKNGDSAGHGPMAPAPEGPAAAADIPAMAYEAGGAAIVPAVVVFLPSPDSTK